MKIVQLGSNKGYDNLFKFIKKNYKNLDFALFVEANSLHINSLKKCYEDYPNAVVENVAIKLPYYDKEHLDIYYSTKDAPDYECASCDINHIYKHIEMCPHLLGGEIKSFSVPCISLDELFQKYNIKDLDWLLIDVEGIDSQILLTTDWNKYNIKKIEYENLHLGDDKEKIESLFKDMGYVKTISLHHYDDCWIKKSEVTEMNVTLYAICKNEEKNVEKFIENSKKFSSTVVVDTGSTDNTVQLLRDAGITVYEHPQTREEFDFSEARNKALSYVETDWAFSLDFNEDVEEFFPEGLEVISGEFTAFKHERYDKVGDDDPTLSNTAHIRFHRTKNYIWVNSVHETPMFMPTESHMNEVSVETTIKITKNVHNTVDKQLFYLSICEREVKKDPNNSYYLWFIFKHYFEVKNIQRAINYGQQYLNASKPYFDPMRIDVFIMCSMLLVSSQNIQMAANYAFHAVSEAMNIGADSLGKAFMHLLEIGKITRNPNIVVFASGFSESTLSLQDRTIAIDKLFLTHLDDVPSCWKGHRNFAEWLVSYKKPEVVVDLGVDHGYSTFCFAMPRIGHVYGIDSFEGDHFAGMRNDNSYVFALHKQEKLHLNENMTFIKGYFDDVAKTWDKKIDILHIDGDHSYESVKNDYDTWSKFLNDDAVILFHDTAIEEIDGKKYEAKKFFDELDLPKVNFTHTFGLGVASKNKDLIDYIQNNFDLNNPL